MPKVLQKLPQSDRAQLWVYKDDIEEIDKAFEAIGLGYMNRHQKFSYMAQHFVQSRGLNRD
jgi:hypothetical protein